MPRINLLPVKAAKRVDTARNELFVFAGAVLMTLVGLYYWYASISSDIDEVNQRIQAIKGDITNVEKQVSRVEEFKKKTLVLEQKLGVIETLKKQKVGPAKMLGDLATILTNNPKVWLTSLVESKGVLTLSGGAMEHENVSEFQLAMQHQSKFFKDVRLTMVTTAKDGDVRYLMWTLTAIAN
jgi:type IV pilus assembly protein PilN